MDVVVTGGLGFGEKITEAETMENFLYTRELLQKSGETDMGSIAIVTSDFHMLRSKLLARRVGFEPYGITSYTPMSARVNYYVREFFALMKSFFLDRVWKSK